MRSRRFGWWVIRVILRMAGVPRKSRFVRSGVNVKVSLQAASDTCRHMID